MLKTKGTSFGRIDKFSVGDIVGWSIMGSEDSGVISDIFLKEVGGRQVAFAKVYGFKDKQSRIIICLNLRLLSKSDSESTEN